MQTRRETIDMTNQGSPTEQLDPMDYPTPGASLTSDPGNAPYEGAAQIVDPQQAIDDILRAFEQPEIMDNLMSAIAAGFPVEAIVKSMAIGGVAEGKFTPDVAEIVKPVIALYLIKTALENNIPVVAFTDEIIDQETKDNQTLERTMNGMEQLAPERTRFVKGKQAMEELKQKAIDAESVVQARNKIRQKEEEMPNVDSDGSFLQMEEV
jgi:hypothetical protein